MPQNRLQTAAENAEKVSPGKAALLSLIVPGSGEFYSGSKGFLSVFLTTEALSWAALFANRWYFNHLVDEYKIFARQHAGFDPTVPREDRFWTDIGKYDDIYAFNDKRERERYFADLYPVTPENYWRWDDHANRLDYDARRIHANDVDNQRVYFQMAIVLNHLVSAINAIRVARKHNRSLQQETKPKMGLRIDTFQQDRYSAYVGVNFNIRF